MRVTSFTLIALVLFLAAASVSAQTSNELFATSMGSVPSGPTTGSQTAQLLVNSNNPAGDTIGVSSVDVRVTATLSNQQYTGVGTGTGNPVVMFGATNGTGSGGPASVPAFGPMNSVGSAVNTNFSNTVAGTRG